MSTPRQRQIQRVLAQLAAGCEIIPGQRTWAENLAIGGVRLDSDPVYPILVNASPSAWAATVGSIRSLIEAVGSDLTGRKLTIGGGHLRFDADDYTFAALRTIKPVVGLVIAGIPGFSGGDRDGDDDLLLAYIPLPPGGTVCHGEDFTINWHVNGILGYQVDP